MSRTETPFGNTLRQFYITRLQGNQELRDEDIWLTHDMLLQAAAETLRSGVLELSVSQNFTGTITVSGTIPGPARVQSVSVYNTQLSTAAIEYAAVVAEQDGVEVPLWHGGPTTAAYEFDGTLWRMAPEAQAGLNVFPQVILADRETTIVLRARISGAVTQTLSCRVAYSHFDLTSVPEGAVVPVPSW